MDDAATLLRTARHRSGLTQRDVARNAGVSQPNISDYEHGHREPTVPTLRRLLAAAGHRLDVRAVPTGEPYTLAEIATHLAAQRDAHVRWRLIHEFLRGFRDGARDDAHRTALIADNPPTVDSRPWDALLAATAEHLGHQHQLPCPAWTTQPERIADRAWFLSELPFARAEALATAPASFRRRRVFVARHELETA